MNYRNVLNKGTSILKKFSIPSAQIDAELLLSLALKKNRERIILNIEENLNTFQAKNYSIKYKSLRIRAYDNRKKFLRKD